MSTIKGVLSEEYQRLKRLVTRYQVIINKLPKGSLSIKIRNKHSYLYQAYRDKKKIMFKYIGPTNSSQATKISDQVQARKKYQLFLTRAKADIKDIEKAFHGRKP